MQTFVREYLEGIKQAIDGIRADSINDAADMLHAVRQNGGRLFIVGVGGSAAAASHAVGDFRKTCRIRAYCFENVTELTARINDDGWNTAWAEWLSVEHIGPQDCLMVISVGGGSVEPPISENLVHAVQTARHVNAAIMAIVGRDGGYAGAIANPVIRIPTVNPEVLTPYCESLHTVVLHLLASHPKLKLESTKWESVDEHKDIC